MLPLAERSPARPYGAMEQSGEHRVAAPRDKVWAALNDPEVLKRCIDGCEALERAGPEALAARVRVKVGPLSAVFSGDIALKDLDPPRGYTLDVSAKGGAAGFARGQAKVSLEDEGAATLMRYSAQGSVGGKLAQIGQRLVDAAARKTADDFFEAFAREVEAPAAAANTQTASAPAAPASSNRPLIWGGVAAAIVAVGLLAWRLIAG